MSVRALRDSHRNQAQGANRRSVRRISSSSISPHYHSSINAIVSLVATSPLQRSVRHDRDQISRQPQTSEKATSASSHVTIGVGATGLIGVIPFGRQAAGAGTMPNRPPGLTVLLAGTSANFGPSNKATTR